MLLGTKYMVAGSLGRIGNLYSLSTRLIDVQTGKIISFAETTSKGSIEEVYLNGVGNNLSQLLSTMNLKYKPSPPTDQIGSPVTGHIQIIYDHIFILEDTNSIYTRRKETKRKAIFSITGETNHHWIIEEDGKQYFLAKIWTKKID
jgi:hypothetical protein